MRPADLIEPCVSILIPCFNAERWIGIAIESALAQTWQKREIIVIDDGSTDGSREIIRSFGDRIRFEAHPHRGGNATRNQLLALSSGDWLQYLDADDYLLPEKVENQVGQLGGGVDLIFGPSLIDRGGDIERLEIPPPFGDPWVLLARWFLPQTGSPLWRKQAIIDAGGWKIDQPCCQEHELYLRLLIDGARFVFSPEAGSVYRKWGSETVCERDPQLVFEHRLAIEAAIESHLQSTSQLTPERHWAINQARFEIARSAWQHDRRLARSAARTIRRSFRDFLPSGSAGPPHYTFIYRTFGFNVAEQIAGSIRGLKGARARFTLSKSDA